MRYARSVLVTAIVMGALVVSSSASAQISSMSIAQAQLGPQGASLSVVVTVQCDAGWTLDGVEVNAAQRSGHFLAQGSGFAFWGAPCVGPGTIVVPVSNSSLVAFRQGRASITADLSVFNLTTGGFATKTVTQTIRLTRQPISYVDPFSRAAVRLGARST
jgi:hypothetical protein